MDREQIKLDWSKESVLELIQLWKKYKCLYDVKHKFYQHKLVRYDVLTKMAVKLKRFFPDIGPNEIKNKLIHLREQYTREIAKQRDSRVGAEDVYWYAQLSFLDDFLKVQKRGSLSDPNSSSTDDSWDFSRQLDDDTPSTSKLPRKDCNRMNRKDTYADATKNSVENIVIVGVPKVTNDAKKFDWSDESILKLIELWKNNECLYDSRHKLYHNKRARHDALNEIANELKTFYPAVGPYEINYQMTYLRREFSREIAKQRERNIEAGYEGAYVPSAYWFKELSFLEDYLQIGKRGLCSLGKPILPQTDDSEQCRRQFDCDTSPAQSSKTPQVGIRNMDLYDIEHEAATYGVQNFKTVCVIKTEEDQITDETIKKDPNFLQADVSWDYSHHLDHNISPVSSHKRLLADSDNSPSLSHKNKTDESSDSSQQLDYNEMLGADSDNTQNNVLEDIECYARKYSKRDKAFCNYILEELYEMENEDIKHQLMETIYNPAMILNDMYLN